MRPRRVLFEAAEGPPPSTSAGRKVAHIVPFDGQDVWSRESHEAVREFFEAGMGETVMVTPLPNSCGQWKQMNAPSVPLVTANISCCGRDLADWLISRRLALPETS
ncbi:hypothetical protein Y032_0005g2511 [Ancylostoma ceylanicum]|uniref:Uncharacterized protein n=1 Tax=Ancylostoma ceylanicum TaxID=53326 RepID=A0A016VSC4_9BILA|nr:hypothetical protein Y032_0005g2511 [Ancylostoma ceylanicum]